MAAAEITKYTNTDKVRSALGFDASDVKDSLLSAAGLDLSLTYDLDDWLPTHATIWADGTASAGVTAEQKKFANVLGMYAQWYCAHEVASKKLLYVQIYSDGKAQLNRFNIDIDSVRDMAEGEMNRWKEMLMELDGQTVTAASFNPVSLSTPDFNPITG